MTDTPDQPAKPQAQVDWHALWQALDQETDPQVVLDQRLRQRAQQYAGVPNDTAADDATAYTMLVFTLGDERYGVQVTHVRGVRPLRHLTRVPGVPAFYRGVVNLRGQIMTVMDLRVFFGLSSLADADRRVPAELVLVTANGLSLALLADHVSEIVRVSQGALETIDMRYAHGVTADGLTLLDAERLLADDRLIVNDHPTHNGPMSGNDPTNTNGKSS